MMDTATDTYSLAYNGPIALGLRLLFILTARSDRSLDIDTLAALDYLVVHSADEGGPESLHPALPQRSGELAVRRPRIEAGLSLLELRGLVARNYSSRGVTYKASAAAPSAANTLLSPYSRALAERAVWAVSYALDGDSLSTRVLENAVKRWDRQLSSATDEVRS